MWQRNNGYSELVVIRLMAEKLCQKTSILGRRDTMLGIVISCPVGMFYFIGSPPPPQTRQQTSYVSLMSALLLRNTLYQPHIANQNYEILSTKNLITSLSSQLTSYTTLTRKCYMALRDAHPEHKVNPI